MDLLTRTPGSFFDLHVREFTESRLLSARGYRAGGSSATVRAIGALAAAVERLGARLEAWARGAAEAEPLPRQSAPAR